MGAGGGGSSGKVDYPQGMRSILYDWLFGYPEWSGQATHDTLDHSVTDELNRLYSSSPYTGITSYDPDSDIADFASAVNDFEVLVDALSYSTDYSAMVTAALSLFSLDTTTLYTTTLDTSTLDTTTQDTSTLDTASIDETRTDDDIDNFDALLTAQITDIDLPKFQAGMLDIGAVNSSAFVIGNALLVAYKNREVAKYGTGLRVELEKLYDEINARFKISRRELDAQHALSYRKITAEHQQNYRRVTAGLQTSYRQITADLQKKYSEQEAALKLERKKQVQSACAVMMGELIRKVELTSNLATLTGEVSKFTILSKKEEQSEQLNIDESDEKWYIEMFQFGANVLGSIGGGTALNPTKRPSAAVSALSGAVGGAAAGASVAPAGYQGYGAAAGAVIGGALGYFGAQ